MHYELLHTASTGVTRIFVPFRFGRDTITRTVTKAGATVTPLAFL